MSEIITIENRSIAPLPLPELGLKIRTATLSDIPFMDTLQKLHSKQVGWMPTKQLEGKIGAGQVLVAELSSGARVVPDPVGRVSAFDASLAYERTGPGTGRAPVGYLIAQDQYFKRDDVGIIYQMNVAPGHQRGLIGASLLKAQFERSAYGCRLYCCWCAQDIAANKFWEAMGFVPLAFRTGSEKKARTHIFWQKRIHQNDVTTPWWFPSKTNGGSIREDRLVLPIPPNTHWSDAKPLVLPGPNVDCGLSIVGKAESKPRPKRQSTVNNPQSKPVLRNGLSCMIPQPGEILKIEKPKVEKAKRVKRKVDPTLAAGVRELRDRWLEELNARPLISLAKYDVVRVEDRTGRVMIEAEAMKRLSA